MVRDRIWTFRNHIILGLFLSLFHLPLNHDKKVYGLNSGTSENAVIEPYLNP
jgi:hypothetical protein